MKDYFSHLRRFFTGVVFQFSVIFILFLCMFAFAMVQGGFASWFIFYTFLPVVLYMLSMLIYPFGSIRATRMIQEKRLFSGDTLHVRLVLKRKHAFPLLLMTVHDDPIETADGNLRQGRVAIFFWMTRETSVTYSIPQLKRGSHHLSTVRLQAGDPFGFFQRTAELDCQSILLVFPKVRPLLVGEAGLGNGVTMFPMSDIDMTQISGVRAYQPNDRLSWLDWKSTARTNRLVTKQFEMERELHASVVLVKKSDSDSKLFERSISFTASLVTRLLQDGYSVVFTYSGTEHPMLLQEYSPRSLGTLYQALARLTDEDALQTEDVRISDTNRNIGFAVSTDLGLASRLSRVASSSRHHQIMFYIDDSDPKAVAQSLAHLSLYFSIYLVATDHFDKLVKVGG